jgi:hypothetical protein
VLRLYTIFWVKGQHFFEDLNYPFLNWNILEFRIYGSGNNVLKKFLFSLQQIEVNIELCELDGQETLSEVI